ncbi:MAG TPA: hypothetical protein VGR47_18350 [Terracidiphilus sp.]|nr:hypothetical protein [Terracidiphilus sp.]
MRGNRVVPGTIDLDAAIPFDRLARIMSLRAVKKTHANGQRILPPCSAPATSIACTVYPGPRVWSSAYASRHTPFSQTSTSPDAAT